MILLNKEEKIISVKDAVSRINRKYSDSGKVTIMKASDMKPKERIPTGIYTLDRIMAGGFPMGHWSTISGRQSSCKSTLCYKLIASAQSMDLRVMYINAEGKFSPEWAVTQGVDLDNLVLVEMEMGTTAEIVLQIYKDAAKGSMADLIIIDSITALAPSRELEKEMDSQNVALAPRIISKFLNNTNGYNYAGNGGRGICSILVTQYRESMDQYAREVDKIPGGNAMKHYAEYMFMCSATSAKKTDPISRDDGFILNVDTLKIPGRRHRVRLFFRYDEGIDTDADLIDAAITSGVIGKPNASTYEYTTIDGELVKVRGIKELYSTIISDESLMNSIKAQMDVAELVLGSSSNDNSNDDEDENTLSEDDSERELGNDE